MRQKLRRLLPLITTGMVVALIAACATTPGIEGGIVGTGNTTDCETLKKKEGAQTSLPEECRRQAGAP